MIMLSKRNLPLKCPDLFIPSAARADRKCPEGRVKDAVFDETIRDR